MYSPVCTYKKLMYPTAEIGNVGLSKDEKQIVALCSPASDAKLYCWNLDLPMVRPQLFISYLIYHIKFIYSVLLLIVHVCATRCRCTL